MVVTAAMDTAYPRPDFGRPHGSWRSLNGLWDFLFDDDDVGRIAGWHRTGLPPSANVTGPVESSRGSQSGALDVLQSITAQPNAILQNNGFGPSNVSRHEKGKIRVPFAFQTEASEVNDQNAHEVIWYERAVEDVRSAEEQQEGHRCLVRFGAVDYETTVWVNGSFVGSHVGGHVPFAFDVTDALGVGSARLVIRVRDSPHNLEQPRGKQYWRPKPESIFYTPTSGIWQTVWLESVPVTRITDSTGGTILRNHQISKGQLDTTIALDGRRANQNLIVELEARFHGIIVNKVQKQVPLEKDQADVAIDLRLSPEQQQELPADLPAKTDKTCWEKGLALWSVEHPLLYDIVIRLLDQAGKVVDEVHTYTGMRSISWSNGDGTFKLNERPFFQALVLDQGYWPKSGLTPPSTNHLKEDIVLAKAMGFNGCRKHQKVEDPVFLFLADKLGYLVWGEIPNAYAFSDQYIERFDREWMEAVRRDINHPSIVVWTPVNESWGYNSLDKDIKQRNHIRSLTLMTKTLDPSRPVNDNCGWEHVTDDLTTFHDYAEPEALTKTCSTLEKILRSEGRKQVFVDPIQGDDGVKHRAGAPIICTEMGGINIAPSPGDGRRDRDWGYTTATDSDDLLQRLEALIIGMVNGGHLCGFVYTQFADIEQEVNGLYTPDRKPKIEPEKVRHVIEKATTLYFDLLWTRILFPD